MDRENPVYEACSQNTRDGLRDTAEIISLGFFCLVMFLVEFLFCFFVLGIFGVGLFSLFWGCWAFYLQVAQSIYP